MGKKDFAKLLFLILILVAFSTVSYGAIPADERAALIALYNSTDGDNWTNNNGWKIPPLDVDGFAMPGTEGNWYGITVTGKTVIKIDLRSNKLSGNIPIEIASLRHMEWLYLNDNQLEGEIPPELEYLENLLLMSLDNNKLSGTIPNEFGNLSHLLSLHLGSNKLTGNIPVELGNISNLDYLNLERNELSGTIPRQIGDLAKLSSLCFSLNHLTGSIPIEIGNLKELEYLNLSGNHLTGRVPKELGKLNNLIYLYLSDNNFTENIPSELKNLTILQHLRLSGNQITGSIPSELGNLINLKDLHLGFNQLGGIIPVGIGNFEELEYLNLRSNQLTGKIPEELGNLSNLRQLWIDNNYLSGEIPKSMINLTHLEAPWVSIMYNCLHTNDPQLKNWLDTIELHWENHQNNCTSSLKYNLYVNSTPNAGIPISINPIDNYGFGDGTTLFYRTYSEGTNVTLEAPEIYNGKEFVKWIINGLDNLNRTVQFIVDRNFRVQAVYESATYVLAVQSSPYSGVGITVSPIDENGAGDGNTSFNRIYKSGERVTLSAPSSFNGKRFVKWTVNNKDFESQSIELTVEGDQTTIAYYETTSPPELAVNQEQLNLGFIIGNSHIPVETFFVYNKGGGTINWKVTTEMFRIKLSPVSGVNWGRVEVTVNPENLLPGKFRGVVYVLDPLVSNSPLEVEINLLVKTQAQSLPPFGEFATPMDNSAVFSSIPVTGWALGDTGIENVKIYREEGTGLVYIGDAVMVEGARPDVEKAYPDYPMNYKAGWGYMLLTNFLPNVGNGTFKLHAIATDKEGLTTSLGVKTIHVDNANAIKPFGAIDTPTQGGTASGNKFVNWGWVLTPQPNKIPLDGSTIKVFVDGVNIGNPTYNIYRSDIADLFPGYANSDGAIGYFYLNTTAYANGVYTIEWVATDSGGNTDGIGSRYFTIQNTRGNVSRMSSSRNIQGGELPDYDRLIKLLGYYSMPVQVKRGWKSNYIPKYPDKDGITTIEIRELERLEVQFPLEFTDIEGYMVSGNQFRPLPIGSTLDKNNNTFYWQPGVGFWGKYEFVFLDSKNSCFGLKLNIIILSKYAGSFH